MKHVSSRDTSFAQMLRKCTSVLMLSARQLVQILNYWMNNEDLKKFEETPKTNIRIIFQDTLCGAFKIEASLYVNSRYRLFKSRDVYLLDLQNVISSVREKVCL